MRRTVVATAMSVLAFSGLAAQLRGQDRDTAVVARERPTPGEQRGWFAPTSPVESAEYLASLADALPEVSLDTLAWIDGGAVEPDSALPILMARVERPPRPEAERFRVLVLAGERGDALTGPEVALQLVRELALGEIGEMLESLELAIVPSLNPWGLLWWTRDEPSGVNPSRDHDRLHSPATRAVHDFVADWRPHLVIELEEIGPSVYRVQAGLSRHPNVNTDLTRFGRFYLLPHVANELSRVSVAFHELVTMVPEAEGPGAPLLGAEGLPDGAWLTPGPLGLEHAMNAFSLGGSLTIMLAVASMGGAEGLADRVQLLYESVGNLLEVSAGQADAFLEYAEQGPAALSLRQSWVTDEEQPNLVWLVWNERGQIQSQTTDRWRPLVRRELALPVPAAWIILPSGRAWAELVSGHGFTVERLEANSKVDVGSYMVGVTAALPSELSEGLPLDSAPSGSALIVPGEREFPEGSWLVRADQPRTRLLFTLIEPWSQDTPLGREAPGSFDPDRLETYPVYRIEDPTAVGALPTEVVRWSGSAAGGAE